MGLYQAEPGTLWDNLRNLDNIKEECRRSVVAAKKNCNDLLGGEPSA